MRRGREFQILGAERRKAQMMVFPTFLQICEWTNGALNRVLNKSSCVNYLLPELRSDTDVTDKLRHPSIFKLPRVRTTRFKSSFINYAVDYYA